MASEVSGEEVFNLLESLRQGGASPRKREQAMARLEEESGLSSDALRAKARRWAKAIGKPYPLMRSVAVGHRRMVIREERRTARAGVKAYRLREGQKVLDRGGTWSEVAAVFGIGTPEGAMQWWKRNAHGVGTEA